MTTSDKNSAETTKTNRNLMMYDLANGARLVGEYLLGGDRFSVANPAVVLVEKGKGEDELKLSINPVLFTGGTLYNVQAQSVVGVFQCFDRTIHEMYNRALKGEKATDAGTNSTDTVVGEA